MWQSMMSFMFLLPFKQKLSYTNWIKALLVEKLLQLVRIQDMLQLLGNVTKKEEIIYSSSFSEHKFILQVT